MDNWLDEADNRELREFLSRLRPGEVLSGAIAAIERFGVFVALDEGPSHPAFPGVGFITLPELSWRRFDSTEDVVQVGQRVSCAFLQFDTWNGEARLSPRALQPDPFQAFAGEVTEGQAMRGQVTKLVPFGIFVRVADGVEGLVPQQEVALSSPGVDDAVPRIGDEVTVSVLRIEPQKRRLTLSLHVDRPICPDPRDQGNRVSI